MLVWLQCEDVCNELISLFDLSWNYFHLFSFSLFFPYLSQEKVIHIINCSKIKAERLRLEGTWLAGMQKDLRLLWTYRSVFCLPCTIFRAFLCRFLKPNKKRCYREMENKTSRTSRGFKVSVHRSILSSTTGKPFICVTKTARRFSIWNTLFLGVSHKEQESNTSSKGR